MRKWEMVNGTAIMTETKTKETDTAGLKEEKYHIMQKKKNIEIQIQRMNQELADLKNEEIQIDSILEGGTQ